jgi:hypothetical protein
MCLVQRRRFDRQVRLVHERLSTPSPRLTIAKPLSIQLELAVRSLVY